MALFYYPPIDVVLTDENGSRVSVPGETIEYFNITQNVTIDDLVSDPEGVIAGGSFDSASLPVAENDVVELRSADYDGTARIVLKASAEEAVLAVENHVSALLLEDNFTTTGADAGLVLAEDLAEPDAAPIVVGTVPKRGETPLQFAVPDGKSLRIYVAAQQKQFDFHAAALEQLSSQVLGAEAPSGDGPPTFTSIVYDSANSEADLVFAKVGTATGNIQVEYKPAGGSTWTTHGTAFAHGTTSGSVVITEQPSAQTYDVRLKQVGVSGYSTTRQVTVDAAPGGGGTPPSNLQAFETLVGGGPDEYEVQLDWVAGSGAGLYTVERRIGSGGVWGTLSSLVATVSFTDGSVFAMSVGKTYYYRVKQNDVAGYSNEASVYIPRDGYGS